MSLELSNVTSSLDNLAGDSVGRLQSLGDRLADLERRVALLENLRAAMGELIDWAGAKTDATPARKRRRRKSGR